MNSTKQFLFSLGVLIVFSPLHGGPPVPPLSELLAQTSPTPAEAAQFQGAAPAAHCDLPSAQRPSIYYNHYRWTTPTTDSNFVAPNKLTLPPSGGTTHIYVKVGETTSYVTRFSSSLIKYPEGKPVANSYRIAGYNDQAPDIYNWGCTWPRIHGFYAGIDSGDNGGLTLRNFYWNHGSSIPPFSANSSATFGFKFTPDTSQAGKIFRISLQVQTGVNGIDKGWYNVFESDSVNHQIYIHVNSSASLLIGPFNGPSLSASCHDQRPDLNYVTSRQIISSDSLLQSVREYAVEDCFGSIMTRQELPYGWSPTPRGRYYLILESSAAMEKFPVTVKVRYLDGTIGKTVVNYCPKQPRQ